MAHHGRRHLRRAAAGARAVAAGNTDAAPARDGRLAKPAGGGGKVGAAGQYRAGGGQRLPAGVVEGPADRHAGRPGAAEPDWRLAEPAPSDGAAAQADGASIHSAGGAACAWHAETCLHRQGRNAAPDAVAQANGVRWVPSNVFETFTPVARTAAQMHDSEDNNVIVRIHVDDA